MPPKKQGYNIKYTWVRLAESLPTHPASIIVGPEDLQPERRRRRLEKEGGGGWGQEKKIRGKVRRSASKISHS